MVTLIAKLIPNDGNRSALPSMQWYRRRSSVLLLKPVDLFA